MATYSYVDEYASSVCHPAHLECITSPSDIERWDGRKSWGCSKLLQQYMDHRRFSAFDVVPRRPRRSTYDKPGRRIPQQIWNAPSVDENVHGLAAEMPVWDTVPRTATLMQLVDHTYCYAALISTDHNVTYSYCTAASIGSHCNSINAGVAGSHDRRLQTSRAAALMTCMIRAALQ